MMQLIVKVCFRNKIWFIQLQRGWNFKKEMQKVISVLILIYFHREKLDSEVLRPSVQQRRTRILWLCVMRKTFACPE